MQRILKVASANRHFRRICRRSHSLTGKIKENQENDKILDEAERLLGEKSFRSIYWLIPDDSDDVSNLAGHIQQAREIEHPIAEVARKIISNSDISLGMVVMLFSQISEAYMNRFNEKKRDVNEILKIHYSVAKVTEMFSITMKIHRSLSYKESDRQSYGNKIAILCGDYLLGQCFSELAHLRDYNLLEFMGSALRDLTLGQCFGPRDKHNKPYPIRPKKTHEDISFLDTFSPDPIETPHFSYNSRNEWMLRNTLGNSGLLGKACLSIAKSAGYTQELQNIAYSFGKYFSLALQVLEEINNLYREASAVNLISLPVLLHLQNDDKLYEHIENHKDNIDEVNYGIVRERVLGGTAIEEARCIKRECADAVSTILNIFERCDAQNLLKNMVRHIMAGNG